MRTTRHGNANSWIHHGSSDGHEGVSDAQFQQTTQPFGLQASEISVIRSFSVAVGFLAIECPITLCETGWLWVSKTFLTAQTPFLWVQITSKGQPISFVCVFRLRVLSVRFRRFWYSPPLSHFKTNEVGLLLLIDKRKPSSRYFTLRFLTSFSFLVISIKSVAQRWWK